MQPIGNLNGMTSVVQGLVACGEEGCIKLETYSRLCTPTHTGHRDWFGCPGVTAATELLNIR